MSRSTLCIAALAAVAWADTPERAWASGDRSDLPRGIAEVPSAGFALHQVAATRTAQAGEPSASADRPPGHSPGAAREPGGSITEAEWTAWSGAFVEPGGRIVDTLAGGISHSEGQGYGMLLAHAAGDIGAFERIWSFTRAEMLLRDDGLVAWKWDPEATPQITDINNATDGDILIAYALLLAAETWGREAYAREASALLAAIRSHALIEHEGRTLIAPGVIGFGPDDRDDGPVINLSYWIFEALPWFEQADPAGPWDAVARDGLALLDAAAFGPHRVPSDWISLAGEPRPADGFDATLGYNGLRIPLYLVREGDRDPERLEPFRAALTADDGLAIVDVATGAATEVANDPGYQAVLALVSCALDGERFPRALRDFAPTEYYPSTLHLLALAYARKELPECL